MYNRKILIEGLGAINDVPLERICQVIEMIAKSFINLDDLEAPETKFAQELCQINEELSKKKGGIR